MEHVSRAQVYVVIPAYNEGTVLPRVVSEVGRAGYTVVVVDDGSTDATADHAHAAGAIVVRHPFNLGQGAALQTGIDYALAHAAQFVVTFDADGQHRVSDIPRLTEALVRERADFALGSRFLGQAPNLPPMRRLMLQAATLFTRLSTGLQVTDTHNGLRAMTRRGAAALRLRQNRMAHASECLSQIGSSGLRYVEQPVTIEYTAYSLAKARWRAHPARSVCAQAVPMIAQLILSALLAAILLYAWAEYRRSPAVAFLTVAIATAGLYFVWMPEHSTQLAELVGIGRGVDLILYVWVCISLVVLLNLHLKLRTQTELITTLARKIAITDAQSRNT
jgi:hypothetical protein